MSLRLFAALDIPDEIAARLVAIQKGVPGARWRPRENLHLTLCFFDEVEEALAEDLDLMLEALSHRVAPFTVALRGAGLFGGEPPTALVARVETNETLSMLAAGCERAGRRLGLLVENRKYQPHVTLAYLAASPFERLIAFERAQSLFSPPPFDVRGFGLYSSQIRQNAPSLYRLEASYVLGGGVRRD